MVGWHHWLNGYEFEPTLGGSEGQGSLARCSLWGHKEWDMTECLIHNNSLIPESSSSWPNYLPNAPPPNAITLGLNWASSVVPAIKNPPAMQETQVRSLGQKILWSSKWQPTPAFLPGKSYCQRSLVGYSPWGHKERLDFNIGILQGHKHSVHNKQFTC